MKTRKSILFAAALAFAIAFISCGGGSEAPHTHDYSAAWTTNAAQHWHECSCGDKKDVADHQWGAYEVTKAPTVTAEGEETSTCATCGEKQTRPIAKLEEIQREFTITGFAKDIIVKDMRTGADDQDLQELGIIDRLEAGLKGQTNLGFVRAVNNDLVIVVEDTTDYARFNAYSGNRLGVRLSYISVDDENIVSRMNTQFASMNAKPFDPITEQP
jgi:hypothetical protein